MTAEIVPAGDLGHGPPLSVEAQQVVIYGPLGTPIAVVSQDAAGAVEFAHALMPNFNEILRRYRIADSVVCDRVDVPRPAGRQLVLG